ncbi:hypothetical protein EYZ11_009252 [Aspergillus tanneri]|uniref:Uncharacterized protein n=1 Tax=Aspergillus tanneri TaxID=1220188 RepID=A0A4S3J8R7_9EURO|nr:hypothetical protein EYZ11_009252 [Aspergillus tanneri]
MSRSTYFPPPPPPPPRLPPYKPRGGAKAPVVHKESPPPPGSFGIGIEMELLLESRFTPSAADNTFPRFARQCAMSYNSSVPSPYPRMHSLVQAHKSLAIIHFEPAFEALVPPERRGNEYSRSNWLDNPQLGYQNLSRDQSIELIESRNTTDEIIGIMNPNQSKYFGWNFLPLKTFRTIEFRRGSASLSANDAFTWVELAMSFIQAAMIQPSSQQLLRYPRTIGGLKDFIQYAHLPQQEGAYNSAYLQRLFTGSHPNAKLNPIPVGHLSEQKRAKLQRKMDADTASNPMLDIIASAQQHGVA